MSKLAFPTNVLDQHAAVLGKTGSGKSSAMRHVVEYLLTKGKRVCVIDPKGDWWGLKAPGTGPGFPVITFGDFKNEIAGDVPINEQSGALVADLITSGNRPAVIGFRGWFTAHMLKFWIDFAKTLFHSNEGELFLIIDETQNFAPKGSLRSIEGQGGLALHWTNRLLAEGRGLGINIWVCSQRPQKVHNDTLDGCETLVAMRIVHPAARSAIADWIKGAEDKKKGATVMDSIGEMKRGEAIIWSPEIEFGPKKVTFPMFQTFDSFAPPQLQKKINQKTWADVDLGAVKEKLASLIKEKEAKDPKALQQQVLSLQLQLRKYQTGPAHIGVEPKVEIREVPILLPGQFERIEQFESRCKSAVTEAKFWYDELFKDVRQLESVMNSAGAAALHPLNKGRCLAKTPSSKSPSQGLDIPAENARLAAAGNRPGKSMTAIAAMDPAVGPSRTVITAPGGDGESFQLTTKQQEILDGVAWYNSIGIDTPTGKQIGALVGVDASGGYFSNVVGPLAKAGLIIRANSTIVLTDNGRQLASVTPIGTLKEYHAILRERVVKLGGSKSGDILDVLISRGDTMTNAEIGSACTIDHTGGYYSNMITPLSTVGLIKRHSGQVFPTEILFPAGLA